MCSVFDGVVSQISLSYAAASLLWVVVVKSVGMDGGVDVEDRKIREPSIIDAPEAIFGRGALPRAGQTRKEIFGQNRRNKHKQDVRRETAARSLSTNSSTTYTPKHPLHCLLASP